MPTAHEYIDPFYNKYSHIHKFGSALPHWDQNWKFQSITIRLYDALPQEVINKTKEEHELWLSQHAQPWSPEDNLYYQIHFVDFFNKYLDQGYGACYLRNIDCARELEKSLWHDHNAKYWLDDYVIMPNHVHILVQMKDHPLDNIIDDWKKFSANRINKILGRRGPLWQQRGYWDTIIRNENHLKEFKDYIWRNWIHGGIVKMNENSICL